MIHQMRRQKFDNEKSESKSETIIDLTCQQN